MRHLTAVQLDPTDTRPGGWHYASLGRRGGGPIGYCAEHAPHPTEIEARECYARYCRDNIKLERGRWSWSGCQVEGCDTPSKNAATSGAYRHATLCDEHLTAEIAAKVLHLDEPAGESWQS